MRSGKVMIVCVVLTLLVSLPMLAQRFRFTLRGSIRTAANANPSLNTHIQLQRWGMPIYEIYVYQSSFQFRDVEEGHYTLVADDPDYETVLEDIDVPSGGVVIDFRPRRNAVRRAEAVTVWDLKVPEPARRQFEAARNKVLENKCSDALALLKKAIHAYAEYGDAHEAMGECYVRMDQLESAEQEFKRALEQPHKPELHLLLGNVHTRQGKQELAARQLELYAEEKSKAQGNQK
jgi:tetratricopeptide (TPR) repeat protein